MRSCSVSAMSLDLLVAVTPSGARFAELLPCSQPRMFHEAIRRGRSELPSGRVLQRSAERVRNRGRSHRGGGQLPARAWCRCATGAAGRVPPGRFLERQVKLIGQGRKPSEHIAKLVLASRRVSPTNGLRELADFLREPRDRRWESAFSVALAVDLVHQLLEAADLHHVLPRSRVHASAPSRLMNVVTPTTVEARLARTRTKLRGRPLRVAREQAQPVKAGWVTTGGAGSVASNGARCVSTSGSHGWSTRHKYDSIPLREPVAPIMYVPTSDTRTLLM